MFHKEDKKINNKIYYLLILTLFLAGVWLNWGSDIMRTFQKNDASDLKNVQSMTYDLQKTTQNSETQTPDDEDNDDSGQAPAVTTDQAVSSGTGIHENEQNKNSDNAVSEKDKFVPYYFVINKKGTINVYYYTSADKCKLIKSTSIQFDTLSNLDQKMLSEGVKIKDEAELQNFLQDYES